MTNLKDDLGREWAGSLDVQSMLVDTFLKGCEQQGISPVDIAGCAQTLLVNLIADISPDLTAALEGLKASMSDMEITMRQRFSGTTIRQ